MAVPSCNHSINYPPDTGGLYEPLVYELCACSGTLRFVCLLKIFYGLICYTVSKIVPQSVRELCAEISIRFWVLDPCAVFKMHCALCSLYCVLGPMQFALCIAYSSVCVVHYEVRTIARKDQLPPILLLEQL